jgi:hypothetical protein
MVDENGYEDGGGSGDVVVSGILSASEEVVLLVLVLPLVTLFLCVEVAGVVLVLVLVLVVVGKGCEVLGLPLCLEAFEANAELNSFSLSLSSRRVLPLL